MESSDNHLFFNEVTVIVKKILLVVAIGTSFGLQGMDLEHGRYVQGWANGFTANNSSIVQGIPDIEEVFDCYKYRRDFHEQRIVVAVIAAKTPNNNDGESDQFGQVKIHVSRSKSRNGSPSFSPTLPTIVEKEDDFYC